MFLFVFGFDLEEFPGFSNPETDMRMLSCTKPSAYRGCLWAGLDHVFATGGLRVRARVKGHGLAPSFA